MASARDFVARFLTDTSKFDTTPAVAELDDLADASDTTARRMDDSFDRIRRTSNDSLDATGKEGTSRARAAGSEIGSEFAQNMGEAFRSGDIKGLVLESLTSLAPALGAAGIGVGVGAALIANVARGAQQAKERLERSVQSVVDNLEVDLTTFAAKFDIQKFLNDSMENLTEGGLVEDVAKFQRLAASGVGEDTLTKILVGDPTVSRKEIEALVRASEAAVTATGREARQSQVDQRDAAREVLALLDQQRTAYDKGTAAVETQVDAQKRLAGYIKTANGLLDDQSRKGLGRFAGKAGLNPTDNS